ncbi:MAG: PhzF family phenazine biosynthesis protein [Bacteroidetes bacterium]|nr:PhzF family phenazine biosynthesis protein [Bacteroidota bacterium]MDA1268751.1 PhzF family phenazine biosynthesis protein [Bacteroidota bacterium]
MRNLAIAVLDSFTEKVFSGNPAAVCLLESPLLKEEMQAIAMEMNLSETAFVEKTQEEGSFSLRWFTPTLEVDLCGHATLASAFWMYAEGWVAEGKVIRFQTRSGELRVTKQDDLICMDFPLIPTRLDHHPAYDGQIFGSKIVQAAQLWRNWIFELADEEAVRSFQPDFVQIAATSEEGFIVTAVGSKGYDMVSRYFGPNVGVPEDPVTGFAHSALVDYWNQKTRKIKFKAYQASKRGGELFLEKKGDRVLIQGKVVRVSVGIMTC